MFGIGTTTRITAAAMAQHGVVDMTSKPTWLAAAIATSAIATSVERVAIAAALAAMTSAVSTTQPSRKQKYLS